jgi:hypothetical protein
MSWTEKESVRFLTTVVVPVGSRLSYDVVKRILVKGVPICVGQNSTMYLFAYNFNGPDDYRHKLKTAPWY